MSKRIEDICLQYTGKPDPLGWRWIATFESYDGAGSPIGGGNTPGEAVQALLDMAEIEA